MVKVMHISSVNISQMVTGQALLFAANIMSHVGFRLANLALTLTYYNGHVGLRNGVSPNIMDFLFMLCM